MRYRRISDSPCDTRDCPAVFSDRQDGRRAIVRGDLLAPTEEIALEEQERAVVVPAPAHRRRGGRTRWWVSRG